MKHRLVFSFRYDAKADKYVMIDPPPDEKTALAADMVEELFIPSWKPCPKPQSITIILHFDAIEGEGT